MTTQGAAVADSSGLAGLLDESRESRDEARRRALPLLGEERIDPNTAGEEDLDRLPGIGPVVAGRIVRMRQDRGPFAGPGDLEAAGKQFAIRHPQPGIVLLLSDFIDKRGYEGGLRFLLARKYDIYALQILSPEEIDPRLAGDLRLTDIEDEDFAEVTVGRALLNRYKRNLEAYCSGLRDFCTARGINYMFTSTEVPFDQMVLSYFRKRGLLK